MIILRKRVGSLKLEGNDINNIVISNDSILKENKIIFNYLPIKNLSFFKLNLEKSLIKNKYWIYLDLNLQDLYNYIKNGMIITKRDLIFDIIKLSTNNFNFDSENFISNVPEIEFNSLQKLSKKNEFNIDNYYCYDSNYYKYNNIYFDITNKIITIDKANRKRIRIPNFYIFNNYYDLLSIKSIICKEDDINDNIFITNKNNSGILKSKINPFYNVNSSMIVHSENLNFQMENYSKELGDDFMKQLELESNNFFYKKKNAFIFSQNLSDLSLKYLSFCKFDKIFLLNYNQSITVSTLNILTSKFNNMRINKKNVYNMLLGNFILKYKILFLKSKNHVINVIDKDINLPLKDWYQITNKHFLTLYSDNLNLSKFVEIGINENWCENYLENLKKQIKIPENDSCPISLLPIDKYGVITKCKHSFNLLYLIKWLKEKNECPICRERIEVEDLQFINDPKLDFIIDFIENEDITVICDKNWYSKLNNHRNIILESDKLDSITSKFIINLSNLSNYDILKFSNKDIIFINT